MKPRKWYGSVGILMQEHSALRESVGKSVTSETIILNQLNIFMHKSYPKLKTPNRYVILHFLSTKKNLMLSGRKNVVVHIRQFCRFLNQRGISCYVPDKTLLPKSTYTPRYFPLHLGDINKLMDGCRSVRKKEPFVGETYSTIIGLLWCTGMRRKEVVMLNHSDVDFENGTILIRQSKFRKTRMIPIEKSVAAALENYLLRKKKLKYALDRDFPFFVNLSGTRVRGGSLCHTFSRVVNRVGLVESRGAHPVIHDLRHNFATHAIRQLYANADNFPAQTFLNILATYLGHSDMLYSQYYIHPDFDLLLKASERFENNRKMA